MSNLCPDGGLPRLIRLVPHDELQEHGVRNHETIALLDAHTNVLRISQEAYELMESVEQHILIRTSEPITYSSNVVPVFA